MTFTPSQLVERFRRRVDDIEGGNQGADFLWSDEDVFDYMEEAQRTFVRRTKILRKTFNFSPTLTSIAYTPPADPDNLVPSDGFVTPSSKIIRPVRARMTTSSNRDPLRITTTEDLDEGFFVRDFGLIFTQDWQNKVGPARFLVTNLQEDRWRLVPIPLTADTLEMTVDHLPENTVDASLAALEVTEREDQLTMLLWMQHLAYLKQDADTYDKELSNRFEALFDKRADERRREIERSRKRHVGMRYGGIRF